MQTIQSMVREFHTTFRTPVQDSLVSLPVSRRDLRLRLILEEFVELVTATGFELGTMHESGDTLTLQQMDAELRVFHVEERQQNPVEMADALGDIVYVCYGMAHELGVNLDAVIEVIHQSNMSKAGSDGQPIINGETEGYREGESGFVDYLPVGKILKGPNYKDPDIASVVFF